MQTARYSSHACFKSSSKETKDCDADSLWLIHAQNLKKEGCRKNLPSNCLGKGIQQYCILKMSQGQAYTYLLLLYVKLSVLNQVNGMQPFVPHHDTHWFPLLLLLSQYFSSRKWEFLFLEIVNNCNKNSLMKTKTYRLMKHTLL